MVTLTGLVATVKLTRSEAVRVRESVHSAGAMAGAGGGTFKEMKTAAEKAACASLAGVLADRNARVEATPAVDPYGDMPTSKGDRTPLAPPSATCRDEPREFVRGRDTDDLVPRAGSIVDLYA
jgi:hypothetical protein